jgi:phage shock protein E
MKKILLSLLAAFMTFTACAKEHNSKHEKFKKEEIIIIDVRTKAEFDAGHVEGAILIPYDEIETRISSVVKDKSKPIALYCRSGRRSGIALRIVESLGYTNAENYGSLQNARTMLDKKSK